MSKPIFIKLLYQPIVDVGSNIFETIDTVFKAVAKDMYDHKKEMIPNESVDSVLVSFGRPIRTRMI